MREVCRREVRIKQAFLLCTLDRHHPSEELFHFVHRNSVKAYRDFLRGGWEKVGGQGKGHLLCAAAQREGMLLRPCLPKKKEGKKGKGIDTNARKENEFFFIFFFFIAGL